MSQHTTPTLAMPGGQKMETILACTDATCGRCFRCRCLATVKTMQEDARLAIVQARGLTALVAIQKEALRSIAARLEGDEDAVRALQQVIDMGPEQALAALTPAPEGQHDDAVETAQFQILGMDPGLDPARSESFELAMPAAEASID